MLINFIAEKDISRGPIKTIDSFQLEKWVDLAWSFYRVSVIMTWFWWQDYNYMSNHPKKIKNAINDFYNITEA